MAKLKPYTISRTNTGQYYCHRRGFPYVPVFGSIGSKQKALKAMHTMNRSCGKEKV